MVKIGVTMRASVTLAVLALWGCGGAKDESPASAPKAYPVLGCESIDPRTCDIRTTPCQTKLLSLAACMRGSDPGELPPVTHLTVAQYTAQLEDAAAMATPDPETSHLDAALAFLDLAEPGALDAEAQIQRIAAGVLAFYRDDSDDIVIIDRDDDDPVASNTTLLHELVHALQDRESDLTAYGNAHFADSTFDGFLAADAMVEGEARLHEDVYAISLLGFDPRDVDLHQTFENIVEQDEAAFLDEPSPAAVAQFVFPYDWGARYMQRAWGGHETILDLLATPPATTHAVLNSVDRIENDSFTPSDIAPPAPPDAWTGVGEDALGAFGTFLLVQKLVGTDQARELALAWRGDVLAIYAGSEASGDPTATAFLWACDFADTKSASAVADALRPALGDVEVQVSGKRVSVAANDAGADNAWAFAGTAK